MNGPDNDMPSNAGGTADEARERSGAPAAVATNGFEQQLARAMQHAATPEGFADRIMERAAKGDTARAFSLLRGFPEKAGRGVFIEENADRTARPGLHLQEKCARAGHAPVRSPERGSPRLFVVPRRQWMGWASGAIAAMLVAGVFAGQHVRVEHERRAVAERQFETATRITDETLEQTRRQLAQQGITLGD
jgi:hypothetical protein